MSVAIVKSIAVSFYDNALLTPILMSILISILTPMCFWHVGMLNVLHVEMLNVFIGTFSGHKQYNNYG